MITEVRRLLDEKKYRALRDLLCDEEPCDVAMLFDKFPKDEIPLMFRILHKDFATEVFVEMDSDLQQALIQAFTDRELSEIINDLFMDDTVDIIEEMPASVVRRILHNTDMERRKKINQLLNYPEDTAGTIMTTEFVRLKAHLTVSDAFKTIKRTGLEKETIYTCYVTDEKRVLLGVVTVKQMLLADEDTLIGDLMVEDPIFCYTDDDKEDVTKAMRKYNFLAMPIVDKENRLVGIVTVDDAMDVLQEEETEDIEIMAAITPTDKPYLKTGVFETWKSRVPWLLILMISATFTSKILTHFESSLAALPILTAFVPLLMGTGGNAGSQSSVSIIRALSLEDIQMRDFAKVLLKEFLVALLCGLSLCIVNFGKMLLFDDVSRSVYGTQQSVLISLSVCITIAITVIIAKVAGSMLPILVKRIGLDPAVMASPFITTIVDVLSLLVYFGICTVLLGRFGIL
ncbi:MAG: magnesium transporter [Ruminococcaceae bacterium]|nr:magnesium transporter [Oscillospiraceae bacterium]